jgi:superfamily I DNA and/or RNA helicase
LQKLATDWIARLKEKRPDDIEHIKGIYIRNANVIGVTCGQVNRLDKFQHSASPFDVVIVDEVSKATPPELFMPLIKGRKIVLVGDHKQLPPLVKNSSLEDVAREIGVSVNDLDHFRRSIFGGLYESAPDHLRCMLVEQFRMRQPIMQAINQFYGDKLQGGHNRSHLLQMPEISSEQCIIWIDTPKGISTYKEDFQGRSSYNDGEIDIIEKLLEQMNAAWMPNFQLNNKRKEIGVITFYLAQRRRISERVGRKRLDALDIRVGTVDKFQGIERQVVIVSLVRNNTRGDIGFAEVPERINVAFSRAQELLVVVGSKSVFTENFSKSGKAKAYYSQIAEIIRREGGDVDAAKFLKETGKSTSSKNR